MVERKKLLAQHISLLIDNGASVLPTQFKKKKVFNPLMLMHDTEESPLLLEVQLHLHIPHTEETKQGVRSRECLCCSMEGAGRILQDLPWSSWQERRMQNALVPNRCLVPGVMAPLNSPFVHE